MSFLAFKIRGVRVTASEIQRLLPNAGYAVIDRQPTGGDLQEVSISEIKFAEQHTELRLYLLLDSYLFEATSLEDAMLQLVNVAFGLGVDERHMVMRTIVKHLRRLSRGGQAALDEWSLLRQNPDSWLSWLVELRNRATHRRLLTMDIILPSIIVGGESPTTGKVPFELRIPTPAGAEP